MVEGVSRATEGSTADPHRLERLLGGAELSRLLDRLVDRLRRGRPLTGTVRIAEATPSERAALAALLGRPPGQGHTLSVPLADLDVVLRRAGAAPDLATAVEVLRGPVGEGAADRARVERAWEALFGEAFHWAQPPLDTWLAQLRGDGLLRRLAGGDPGVAADLLEQARAVLLRLPADGLPRSVLAGQAVGDSHALDDGRPLATLVLRAIPLLAVDGTEDAGPASDGAPADGDGTTHPASDAATRGARWSAVGVRTSALAGLVLTLGLRAADTSATSQALAALAEEGEPAALTLRQLVGDAPRWRPGEVFVCENLAVLETAADRLGVACAPLVCVDGWPSRAASTLLRDLAAAGATLRYHGDFDWPGLRIANDLHERVDAASWRMRARDYRGAVARSNRPLRGQPVGAVWDPELGEAMLASGVRVEEELVVDELLADLAG